MADIFISYSQQDKALAEQLAGLLTEIGFTVWWDAALIPAEQFREEIRRQIEAARAVIVIWSANSAKSAFVIDEADVGRERNKLISTLAEGFPVSRVPLGFRNAHMTPLADGEALIKALAARGLTTRKPVSGFLLALFRDRMAVGRSQRRPWLLPAALTLVIAGLLGWIGLSLVPGRPAPPSPVDNVRATYGWESRETEDKITLSASGSRPFFVRGVQSYVLTFNLELVKKEEDTTVFYNTGAWSLSMMIDTQVRSALATKGYIATCIQVSATENGAVSTIGILRRSGDFRTMQLSDNKDTLISMQFGAAEASAIAELSKRHNCNYRL
jgi:hypothetical protein